MDWIKISDKKPKEGQRVLFYFEHVGVDIGVFSTIKLDKISKGYECDCFSSQNGFLVDDVTHWQPISIPELNEIK